MGTNQISLRYWGVLHGCGTIRSRCVTSLLRRAVATPSCGVLLQPHSNPRFIILSARHCYMWARRVAPRDNNNSRHIANNITTLLVCDIDAHSSRTGGGGLHHRRIYKEPLLLFTTLRQTSTAHTMNVVASSRSPVGCHLGTMMVHHPHDESSSSYV